MSYIYILYVAIFNVPLCNTSLLVLRLLQRDEDKNHKF